LGLGPLLDLMGLFHAVLSGVGLITITFISCREMMPDPEFYKTCLQEAYEELRLAAQLAVVHDAVAKKTRSKSKTKTKKKMKKKPV